MVTDRIQWQLRYRSPLSPTRGVDDVIIETDTDDQEAATALSKWWLANKMPSPSTTFVFCRRLVVATSAEMRAALKATSAPASDAKPAAESEAKAAVEKEPAISGAAKPGRVGA